MQLTPTALLSHTWHERVWLVMWPLLEYQLIFILRTGVLLSSAQVFGTNYFHSNKCPKK